MSFLSRRRERQEDLARRNDLRDWEFFIRFRLKEFEAVAAGGSEAGTFCNVGMTHLVPLFASDRSLRAIRGPASVSLDGVRLWTPEMTLIMSWNFDHCTDVLTDMDGPVSVRFVTGDDGDAEEQVGLYEPTRKLAWLTSVAWMAHTDGIDASVAFLREEWNRVRSMLQSTTRPA